MLTYLLDTNVCIGAMRGDEGIRQALAGRHPNDLGVSMITVFELYSGVALCRDPVTEGEKVDRFLGALHVLPFDLAPSMRAAGVRAALQERGTMIGPFDLLIAGHALALELTLVTNNLGEFERVPGLDLEDWQKNGGLPREGGRRKMQQGD
jgi:tRNA(fMet)-specific endonuclease VapC